MNNVHIITQICQGGYTIINPYYHLGTTLKKIRKNKGYTQEEVSQNIMSRSNYTKVEMNVVNPNTIKFFAILDHIDMSEAEFSFISNGYKLNEKNNILYLFRNMGQSPALSYIQNLTNLSTHSLDKREDHLVRDILNISLGYWALLQEHDLSKAKNHANKVWARLKELDKFYLSEFHLLNRILFLFDLETAVSITNTALVKLEDYFCFEEAEELKLSFMSNIASILIDNKQYDRAMEYVELLISDSKKDHNVLVWASALVRQGLCQVSSGQEESSESSYHSASDMFTLLERDDLVTGVTENPKTVLNSFGHVNLMPEMA